ncbi:hypothetical protein ND861_09040 [Leptospira sp. 2 VSF19]|uniref:Uncharacterized protein n=1 Tax=Leptospira soteropolitanensis TaxID=2950025 RepID=A0AAW5VMD8_9LEPT|nr:hypothetical protein [Leptospira soteropolitanensis]MCW7492652.1 hypothetical protein [Leptospira soteropolitanensis]MCW7500335.1 hypothetical protein [Leptospira soteropolitanensis]MCW7522630.1 hypothetical protein [Leptospira soteropolitanensis]MCW7526486.1 hypothetical protein [Leptospira soteropolitanensis]MCW7530305.1 hypothetical protein [Leptospira soteropolitanensis]
MEIQAPNNKNNVTSNDLLFPLHIDPIPLDLLLQSWILFRLYDKSRKFTNVHRFADNWQEYFPV